MTLEYSYTVDDAVAQATLDAKRDPRVRAMRRSTQRTMLMGAGLMLLAVGIMLALSMITGDWKYRHGLFTGLAGSTNVLLVWAAATMVRSGKIVEKAVRQHPERLRLGPRRLTVHPTHLEVVGEHLEVRHGWPDLQEVVDDTGMVGVVDRFGTLVAAVPNRAFSGAAERLAFIAEVRERLMPSAPPTAGTLGVQRAG